MIKKFTAVILCFFLVTGFSWGRSDEDTDTREQTTSTSTSRSSSSYSSQTSQTARSRGAVKTQNAKVENLSIAKAVAGGETDPDELKKRIESLARVSRALKALNAKKRA